MSLQTELDVPATGTSSKELVVALAKLQTDKGLRTANGVLSKSTRAWLVGLFPKLAEIPQEPRVAGLRQGNVAAKAEAPEDEAIRRLHLGSGYQGFVAGFKSMSFLGQGVVGHPEFLGRLANAQNYLASKFPGKSDGEIGVELGVIRTSHFRTSTKTKDNMYHGLGFALDINPVQNNWNFGNRGRGVKLSDVMKHVGDLFGEGMIRGAGDMSKNAKNGTTEELSRPTGRGSTCSRSPRGSSCRTRARRAEVHLDTRHDAGLDEGRDEAGAVLRSLADRLVVQDGATDGFPQPRCRDDKLAILAPAFGGLRDAPTCKPLVAGPVALIHGEQALVIRE